MADQTMGPWRRIVRNRVVVGAALLAGWVVVIEARLVQLQVAQHAQWQAIGDAQIKHEQPVPARRGEITDRHGQSLAYSIDGTAVYAVPSEIKDVAGTVRALCNAFRDCSDSERAQLAQKLGRRGAFTYVRRAARVTPEAAARIKELALPGISFRTEPQRFYPNGELGAHVLGFVDIDSRGLSGVELAYNKTLKGADGSMVIQIDGAQRPFESIATSPTPGPKLQLTIDYYLQFIAEQELKAAVEYNNAQGGSVVIMDPFTGDILAMANAPSFDPNVYSKADSTEIRNRAIQDMYEPGSTFKIVTASAAIEEGVMRPDDPIDVSAGSIRIGSRKPIFDTHRYGVLSFTDVLVKSSNVGAIKIGQRLGSERLGRYAKGFGFGTRLARDFKGSENAGSLYDPSRWNESVLASVSMGYQVAVTPLQMATAASIVANGGELRQPRVVKAQVNADGSVAEVAPRVVRRVIHKSTADQLTAIMEQVVERGTATAAKIPGYSIAGKTGTSAKLEPNGHYSKSNYNASFVGFIPSRAPALAIIVVIDSPHGHGYYGGVVSAPVFKRIAEKAMQRLGIGPNLAPTQPVLVAQHESAGTVRPTPAKAVMPAPAPITAARVNPGTVPDVIGLSAREAIRVLARVGLVARVSGDGIVIQQEPRAGSALERGTRCTLALGRLATAVPAVSDQHQ